MTTHVLVLSDTHGLLRPRLLEEAATCDLLLHAGDFDDDETYNALASLAPLCAVRGNNDWHMDANLVPSLEFTVEDARFFMVHNRADAPRSLPKVDAVVFGHSHRYYERREDGVLWLNPGCCGRRMFGGELSFVRLTVDGRSMTVQKIVLSGER